jgi:phage head maturation protease
MSTLDTIRGYAVIWNRRSHDMATTGAARYETIPPDSLTIAANLRFDSHHFDGSAFAFSHDGSGRAWCDDFGLAFAADMPKTANGYDVRNGLASGLRLGVSVLLAGMEFERDDGGPVAVVRRAEVRAISIMKPGRAVYPDPCVWLASAPAGSLPRDVEDARRRWREPRAFAPQASAARQAPALGARNARACLLRSAAAAESR